MKIALVHDYLIDYGGAERVFEEIHEIFPNAPIYTLITDEKGMGKFLDKFKNTKIHTSWFNYLPFAPKLISPLRFMIPLLWAGFDFSDFDLVISSASWAVTKGFGRPDKPKEICYLHTPPRYLYNFDTSRDWKNKWFSWFVDIYALIVNHFMRQYDFNRAQNVSLFLANSVNVGKRIEKFYRRTDYKVLYPPVFIGRKRGKIKFTGDGIKEYYLTGGRMVKAKNFDLIIKSCQMANVKLKIFGIGIEEENLKRMAGSNIEFLGRVDDERLRDLYSNAKAFILAQKDEDFGITAIEAASNGCPSIAYNGGGYKETIKDKETGIFFSELTADSLTLSIKNFENSFVKNQSAYRKMQENAVIWAENFSSDKFRKGLKDIVAGFDLI